MPTLNSKVKSFRLPEELDKKLESVEYREHKALLIKFLLEDYFAGKNIYTQIRFREALSRKANSNGKRNFRAS